MNKSKRTFVMALANFSSWSHSPRTILMFLFIVSLCFLQTNSFQQMLRETGYRMHLTETMFFHFNVGCNMTYISMAFLIMANELPLQIRFQDDMLIRGTKRQWIFAQLVYALFMVLSMIFLLVIFICLFSLSHITSGDGWSDFIRIANHEISEDETLVAKYVLDNFFPFSAFLTSLLPLFFFWYTMLLIIMLCSFCGFPMLETLVYASLLVLNITILHELLPISIPLPITFATFGSITNAVVDDKTRHLIQCIAGYIALDCILVLLLFQRARLMDMHFENKKL